MLNNCHIEQMIVKISGFAAKRSLQMIKQTRPLTGKLNKGDILAALLNELYSSYLMTKFINSGII